MLSNLQIFSFGYLTEDSEICKLDKSQNSLLNGMYFTFPKKFQNQVFEENHVKKELLLQQAQISSCIFEMKVQSSADDQSNLQNSQQENQLLDEETTVKHFQGKFCFCNSIKIYLEKVDFLLQTHDQIDYSVIVKIPEKYIYEQIPTKLMMIIYSLTLGCKKFVIDKIYQELTTWMLEVFQEIQQYPDQLIDVNNNLQPFNEDAVGQNEQNFGLFTVENFQQLLQYVGNLTNDLNDENLLTKIQKFVMINMTPNIIEAYHSCWEIYLKNNEDHNIKYNAQNMDSHLEIVMEIIQFITWGLSKESIKILNEEFENLRQKRSYQSQKICREFIVKQFENLENKLRQGLFARYEDFQEEFNLFQYYYYQEMKTQPQKSQVFKEFGMQVYQTAAKAFCTVPNALELGENSEKKHTLKAQSNFNESDSNYSYQTNCNSNMNEQRSVSKNLQKDLEIAEQIKKIEDLEALLQEKNKLISEKSKNKESFQSLQDSYESSILQLNSQIEKLKLKSDYLLNDKQSLEQILLEKEEKISFSENEQDQLILRFNQTIQQLQLEKESEIEETVKKLEQHMQDGVCIKLRKLQEAIVNKEKQMEQGQLQQEKELADRITNKEKQFENIINSMQAQYEEEAQISDKETKYIIEDKEREVRELDVQYQAEIEEIQRNYQNTIEEINKRAEELEMVIENSGKNRLEKEREAAEQFKQIFELQKKVLFYEEESQTKSNAPQVCLVASSTQTTLLSDQINRLQDQRKFFQDKYVKASKTLEEIQSTYNREISILENQLKENIGIIQNLEWTRNYIEEQQQQINQLREDRKELEKIVGRLEKDKEVIQKEKNSIERKYFNVVAEKQKISREKEQTLADREQAFNEMIREKSEEKNNLIQDVKRLNEKNRDANFKLQNLENTLQNMQAEKEKQRKKSQWNEQLLQKQEQKFQILQKNITSATTQHIPQQLTVTVAAASNTEQPRTVKPREISIEKINLFESQIEAPNSSSSPISSLSNSFLNSSNTGNMLYRNNNHHTNNHSTNTFLTNYIQSQIGNTSQDNSFTNTSQISSNSHSISTTPTGRNYNSNQLKASFTRVPNPRKQENGSTNNYSSYINNTNINMNNEQREQEFSRITLSRNSILKSPVSSSNVPSGYNQNSIYPSKGTNSQASPNSGLNSFSSSNIISHRNQNKNLSQVFNANNDGLQISPILNSSHQAVLSNSNIQTRGYGGVEGSSNISVNSFQAPLSERRDDNQMVVKSQSKLTLSGLSSSASSNNIIQNSYNNTLQNTVIQQNKNQFSRFLLGGDQMKQR